MIAALPGNGRAERVLVALGPGSFTGIRIGIATARALAPVWRADALGYPTLALVAAMAQRNHPGEPVDVAMTGGHGEWFVQSYSSDGRPMAHVGSLAPDVATRICTNTIVVGTQAEALVAARGNGTAVTLHPDASFALLLADGALTKNLSPIYGREPDAEPLDQQMKAR